jgi:hypothetical protein
MVGLQGVKKFGSSLFSVGKEGRQGEIWNS